VIDAILDGFEAALTFLHDIFEPLFGVNSWGWAIIALTLIVRIALLPLAIKQTRSMRAMQALQPQLKELQAKYKVDRDLMRKDPEQYKAKKAKLNEEMMALYQREGANPAASCLPLLAQAPIFLALFYTLRRSDDLLGAPFYFFTDFVAADAELTGLAAIVSQAGWPGWLLIVLMSGTMFVSQKQMMARTAATQGPDAAPNPMAQQQKILLYVMPVFLAVISFQFPLGILLYWVTTNAWQVVQQWIILREVQHEVEEGTLADKPGGSAAARWMKNRRRSGADAKETPEADGPPRRISPGASSGKKPLDPKTPPTDPAQDPPETRDGKATNRDSGGTGASAAEPGVAGDASNDATDDATIETTPPGAQDADDRPVPRPDNGGSSAPDGPSVADDGSSALPPSNGQRPAASRDHLPRRRRGGGTTS
jgi:YidC/Oxa1 family membrane protein insertase